MEEIRIIFLLSFFATIGSATSIMPAAFTHMDGLSRRCSDSEGSLYHYTLRNLEDTHNIPLMKYMGKFVLVVNVASFCDFTVQYLALNALNELEDLEDFEIIAVPCNQFAYQEPGRNKSEILNSLKYVRPGHGYTPNFDLYMKADVNGENELPLYTYLKSTCPSVKIEIGDPKDRFYTPFRNNDITWNFNKFLIDPYGIPLKRYDSTVEPMDILPDIRLFMKAYR